MNCGFFVQSRNFLGSISHHGSPRETKIFAFKNLGFAGRAVMIRFSRVHRFLRKAVHTGKNEGLNNMKLVAILEFFKIPKSATYMTLQRIKFIKISY